VEFMQSMLEHECWQFHPLLPKVWMVEGSSASRAAKSSKEYLAWDATLLRSYKAALEFLQASSLTSEDITSFEEFAADESRKLRVQVFDWREDDPCLPEGWRYEAVVGSGSGRRLVLPLARRGAPVPEPQARAARHDQ
jgi:hypothetical protein